MPEGDRWFGPAPPSPPGAPEARRPDDALARTMWTVLAVDLALVLLGVVRTLVVGLPEDRRTPDEIRAELWATNALAFLAFALIPFAWALGTRRTPWRGSFRRLRLDRPWPGVVLGLLLLLAAFAIVRILAEVALALDPDLLENPVVAELGGALTWPLVVATAIVAGVGEEVLFRGLLQKWVGIVPQALLFALLHFGYGTVLQVVAPLLMGLLFGYVVKRGWGLWAPITAHVLYDFAALSFARACALDPDLAVCAA